MKIPVAIGAVLLVLSGGALGGVLSGTLTSSGTTTVGRAAAAPTAEDDPAEDRDEADPKDKKDKAQKKDKQDKKKDKADKHRQQRAFVTAKKAWSTCVAESDSQRGRNRFDPEQVCGAKPHPHDLSGKPGHARSR